MVSFCRCGHYNYQAYPMWNRISFDALFSLKTILKKKIYSYIISFKFSIGIAIKLWPFHKGLKPQFENETESLKEKKNNNK